MKKWLSMLLAAILILNIVLPTNVFAETDANSLNEVTLYVSASGNDSTGDGSSAKPYKTISKAESVIETDDAADLGRIVISGEVAFSASAHTKMITITGDGQEGTKLNLGANSKPTAIQGPTTFEAIDLAPVDSTYNSGLIESGQHELIFGTGVQVLRFNGYFRVGSDLGQVGTQNGTGKTPTLTVGSLSHNNLAYSSNNIRVGSTGGGAWMDGAMVTINGGTINEINIHRATQFSKDVNFVFNGGTVKTLTTSIASIPGTYKFAKALQIVFNNGMRPTTFDKAKFDSIPDDGGKWYIYGDNTGGSLNTTDKSGIFLVNGTGVTAKATNLVTNEVYYADCGSYLRIPAGEYNVTYLPKADDVIRGLAIRYVSATGDDTNDGLTKESAFKTVSKAEASLEEVFVANEASEGLIFVSGSLNFTAATHTKMITITGDGNSSTVLNIAPANAEINIAGPTTFENITLTGSYNVNQGQLQTQQNELVIGKGVTFSGSYNSYFRVGANNAVSGNEQGTGNIPTLVFDGVAHATTSSNICIGTGYGNWMNGANITINGGKVADINFHRATQFSKNVNIVINGGTIGTIQKQTHASFTGTYKFHKALQIVFNNGSINNVTTFNKTSIEDFTAIGGKWYIYGDNTGGSLSVTETAGTFKVNGDKYGKATLTTDASKVYYCVPDGMLTLPAGEYNVTYLEEKPAGLVEVVLDDKSQGLFSNGATFELPVLEKEGYTFLGWTDGSTIYEAGQEVTLTSDLVLTSSWYKESVIAYVSSAGNDSNTGDEENPFLTISHAISTLDAMNAKNRKIVMLTDMVYTDANHVNEIEITGKTDSVKLKINSKTALGGPIVFKNFTTGTTFSPVSNGHKVSYENIKGGGTSIDKVYVGTINNNGGQKDEVEFTSFGTSGASMLRICGVEAATSDVNLILNSGKFHQVMFEGTNTFNGDVNITVNGGTFGSAIGYNFTSATTFNKNFQLVINDGTGNINVNENLREIISNGRSWFMYDDVDESTASIRSDRKQYAGCSMEVTDTVGTFNIVNGSKLETVYAVATNLENPTLVYYSSVSTADKAGTLTVPAGEWVVTYEIEKPDWYCTGSQIVFNNTVNNFDFADITTIEYEDKIIVGWMNGQELANNGTFEAGTRLNAVYATNTKKANFYVSNTEIRLDDGALRFKINMNLGLYDELNGYADDDAEYGIIAIKAENVDYADCADIVIEGTYNGKTPAIIQAQNVYSMYDDEMTYTLCLTDIGETADDFYTDYMIKGYIKFTDKNGIEKVVYTEFEQSSVKATVEKMLSDNTVSESIKDTLDKKYMTVINAKRNELATTYVGTEIDFDDGLANPFKVREITIDAENVADSDAFTIVQLSDLHINHLNNKDFIDNRQTVLSFYRNRNHGINGAFAKLAERALAYADAVADQVIVTGDTLDNMNEGAFDITKRLIWSRYPNIISTTGNHEWTERSVGKVAEVLTKDEMQQRLQEDSTHDVLYSMKLMNGVMLIQMDNASGNNGEGYGYEQSQIDSLTRDLAIAKENNYTVLLFQHVPLKEDEPHDPSGVNDNAKYYNEIKTPTSTPTTNKTTTGYCNAEMIELIKNNSDVIKAIFCGHEHFTVDTTVGGIPQYLAASNQYDGGCAVKIIVK